MSEPLVDDPRRPNRPSVQSSLSSTLLHLAYCVRRTSQTLAEDAAAEVFAVAWRRVSELPAEPQTLPWLPGPEGHAINQSVHDEVALAIMSLKPKYRDVIRLVEWEGLTRNDVAEMMGVSRAAIDQRIHRAYQQLARRLDHLLVGDRRGGNHATEPAS